VIWDVPRAPIDGTLANEIDTIPGDWAVVQGFRTKAQQDALYAQGRTTPGDIVTQAPYPRSAHCWGLAVDVARVTPSGQRVWDYAHPAWQQLQLFVNNSPHMHGGWHFPIADNDHIQSVDWIKWRENLITEGRW